MNNQVLYCSVCNFECTHILGNIEVKTDDNQVKEIIINHRYSIPSDIVYEFRSQGNIHILFICENGHYFIKSLDGHKGTIYIDDNSLMDELAAFLNAKREREGTEELNIYFDYTLLGSIEEFFHSKEAINNRLSFF